MSILEQDEIDRLQLELANVERLKDLALRAKEKIRAMYFSVLSTICVSDLETLEDIGEVIDKLDSKINRQSKYFDSFNLLKQSYQRRL